MKDVRPIGAFSRATLISADTLRAYHENGLLEPAVVDPRTGYRGYRAAQLGDAAVIRDLRALDVPLAKIREVLAARDPEVTRRILSEHRERVLAQHERIEHAKVRRLLEIGATHRSDHDEYGHRWTVLHDPSGNEFCVA